VRRRCAAGASTARARPIWTSDPPQWPCAAPRAAESNRLDAALPKKSLFVHAVPIAWRRCIRFPLYLLLPTNAHAPAFTALRGTAAQNSTTLVRAASENAYTHTRTAQQQKARGSLPWLHRTAVGLRLSFAARGRRGGVSHFDYYARALRTIQPWFCVLCVGSVWVFVGVLLRSRVWLCRYVHDAHGYVHGG